MYANKTQLGKEGETIALNYLKDRGFNLIEKNFHTKYGEIDLIFHKGKDIYFFEVKYRKNAEFGYGEESISRSKIEKIRKSIEIWISKNQLRYKFENAYLNALVIDSKEIREFEIF